MSVATTQAEYDRFFAHTAAEIAAGGNQQGEARLTAEDIRQLTAQMAEVRSEIAGLRSESNSTGVAIATGINELVDIGRDNQINGQLVVTE